MTTEKQDHKRIIRQHFDDALIKQMARLLGKSRLPAKLPLNLLNVSCMVLMAEQQANEEKHFSAPEDRYTRETLFQELSEIGLDSEVAYEAMLEQMLQLEYLHMDSGGLIAGNEPAAQMARNIDSILPQMPGLNLIAYIAQTIDEAVSGRKDLADAVDQFNQTLVQQGITVGKRKPETLEEKKDIPATGSSIGRSHSEPKEPKSKSLLSAEDYNSLQQAFQNHDGLSEKSSERRIISSNGSHEKIDVKAVSFGAPPPEAEANVEEKLAAETTLEEEISEETLAKQSESEDGDRKAEDGGRRSEDGGQKSDVGDLGPGDRATKDRASEDGGRKSVVGGQSSEDGERKSEVGSQKSEIDDQRTDDGSQRPEEGAPEAGGQRSEDGASEDGGRKSEVSDLGPGVGGSEDRATEDRTTEVGTTEDRRQKSEDGERKSEAGSQKSEVGSIDGDQLTGIEENTDAVEPEDDVIESRISAFEENLSMQCPICKSGEITAEKTIKMKTYFKCLNRACNFISWGKPYHKVCPRCQNPFLIEQERKGRTILTCPRSTCDYWQGDPADKATDTDAQQPTAVKSGNSRPRKRVVKRRVVRRKKA